MPITFAHPAAVLPLRRLGLPMAALVAGSIVPDLPVFAGQWGWYDVTHSWLGVLVIDPALAAVALALWFTVLRDPLVDVLPAAVRLRVAPSARLSRSDWVRVVPAAVVGSLTHVAWDLFTHPGRWGVRQVDWLHSSHAGHLGSSWVHLVSSVVGIAIVVAAAAHWLWRRPVQHRPVRVPRLGARALGGALLTAGLLTLVTLVLRDPYHPRVIAFVVVTHGTVWVCVALAVLSLWWHRLLRASRPERRADPGSAAGAPRLPGDPAAADTPGHL